MKAKKIPQKQINKNLVKAINQLSKEIHILKHTNNCHYQMLMALQQQVVCLENIIKTHRHTQ